MSLKVVHLDSFQDPHLNLNSGSTTLKNTEFRTENADQDIESRKFGLRPRQSKYGSGYYICYNFSILNWKFSSK